MLQHFAKRLGPEDTLNAVHEFIFIMVTCSLACGKVTSNLEPLPKFSFEVIQPSICKFYWWVKSVWLLLHKFWSQVSQRKKPFSDFPARGPGIYTLSWGIHKVAVAVCWPGKLKSKMAVIEWINSSLETQGHLVGSIKCSWWKFTVRSRRAAGHLLLPNQFQKCLNCLLLIGQKKFFLANQQREAAGWLSCFLTRRSFPHRSP